MQITFLLLFIYDLSLSLYSDLKSIALLFFVNTADEHRFYFDLASKQQAGEIFQRMKISTLVRLVCLRNLLFNKQKKIYHLR